MSGFGLDPDLPAVTFDDAVTECEPDSRPRMLVAAVKPLEHLEDTLLLCGIDPDPPITNRDDPVLAVPFGVDLEAVLEDVLTDLERRIEEADAEIEVHALPRVSGDASQLRQLFQNLVANAVEYSSDGSPGIVVDAERDGEEWIVSVHDNGIGIDPDDQARIFEVFQRLHSREEHPGTGIGLALCKRVVERHGGEIWVESEPGDGSTFSVSLPAVDAPTSDRSPRGEPAVPSPPSSLNR